MVGIDLTRFGFTPTESLVYESLLRSGPGTGYAIVRAAGLARAKGMLQYGPPNMNSAGIAEEVARMLDVGPDQVVERIERLLDRLREEGWQSDFAWTEIGSGSAQAAVRSGDGGTARRTIAYLPSVRAADGGAGRVWKTGDVPVPAEADAREALEDLARALFENHGLTLQPEKTEIMTADDYRERFALAPDRVEAESLTTRFRDLLDRAGVADRYSEDIEYDDLPADVQEEIDGLNLEEVFDEQINEDPIDPIVIRILLHRLGQLDINVSASVLDNLRNLSPVMDSVIRYLQHLRDIPDADRAEADRDQVDGADAGDRRGRPRG
jgi:hypothetical protein